MKTRNVPEHWYWWYQVILEVSVSVKTGPVSLEVIGNKISINSVLEKLGVYIGYCF